MTAPTPPTDTVVAAATPKVEAPVKAKEAIKPKVQAKKASPQKAAIPKAAVPKKVEPKKAVKKESPTVLKLVKNVKGAQLPRPSKPGPAMVRLAAKIKVKFEEGECRFRGCSRKAVTSRAKWCLGHKKAIRKAQLKANNAIWRKRVKSGVAGHHVVYDGAATEYALQHKDQALKIVTSGRSILKTRTEFEKAIRSVPADLRKALKAQRA